MRLKTELLRKNKKKFPKNRIVTHTKKVLKTNFVFQTVARKSNVPLN